MPTEIPVGHTSGLKRRKIQPLKGNIKLKPLPPDPKKPKKKRSNALEFKILKDGDTRILYSSPEQIQARIIRERIKRHLSGEMFGVVGSTFDDLKGRDSMVDAHIEQTKMLPHIPEYIDVDNQAQQNVFQSLYWVMEKLYGKDFTERIADVQALHGWWLLVQRPNTLTKLKSALYRTYKTSEMKNADEQAEPISETRGRKPLLDKGRQCPFYLGHGETYRQMRDILDKMPHETTSGLITQILYRSVPIILAGLENDSNIDTQEVTFNFRYIH
jgi:hypothetical protein